MILGAKKLAAELKLGAACDPDGIAVVPTPDPDKIALSGEASITLRLGRWFLTLRQSSETHLKAIHVPAAAAENKFVKKAFVPFGERFVIHPGRFILASTLEWIRLPPCYAAFVVGKSTLGRRGVIIETAAGVHPGFSGCLTLEIGNVGEVPVELIAGMPICQLFFHRVEGELSVAGTPLAGQRKPRLGQVKADAILSKLMETKS